MKILKIRAIPVLLETDQTIPTGAYLFKANIGYTRAMCEVCWKLTIKTPEWRQWCRSGVFIANFEQISHIDLMLPLLTLNKQISTRIGTFQVFCENGAFRGIEYSRTRNLPFRTEIQLLKKGKMQFCDAEMLFWNFWETFLGSCNRKYPSILAWLLKRTHVNINF